MIKLVRERERGIQMYLELNSLELRAVSCYLWEFPVGSSSVTDRWIGLERGIPPAIAAPGCAFN